MLHSNRCSICFLTGIPYLPYVVLLYLHTLLYLRNSSFFTIRTVITSWWKMSNSALDSAIFLPHLCIRSWLIWDLNINHYPRSKTTVFNILIKTVSSISQLLSNRSWENQYSLCLPGRWWQTNWNPTKTGFKIHYPAYALKAKMAKTWSNIQSQMWHERPDIRTW